VSVHLITPQEAFLKDAPAPKTRSRSASQQETGDPKQPSKALSKALSSDQPPSRGHFDAIIDVRSEDEFALDHWPGAVNWPVLNNAERVTVGTLYKQVSAFEAQKKGAALVAANIARHIEAHVMDLPKSWQPLLYCWRGGKRSGSISGVLSQIGFRVHLLEGGYKAFRQAVVEDIPKLIEPLQFEVIAGPTGCGKTRLLSSLKSQGAQVLDLEDLANHRSSVLGFIPGSPQPSQKHFDTLVWQSLRGFDPSRVIFVESESKKVGNLSIPVELIEKMRSSSCSLVELSMPERVALLMEDYAFLVQDPELFIHKLQALVNLRGRAVIDAWCQDTRQGRIEDVVQELLTLHYDPTYLSSMKRNFTRLDQARRVNLLHRHAPAMQEAARFLIEELSANESTQHP
jgi:tRNA 2-selenouridine synthase